MHAEILAIGDEIASGQLLDTNSQWLSQRLEELGVRVLYHSTAGDELEPCAEVFRRAMARADIVVATGGLGPTADDLTRDALALAAGRPLQPDPAALEHIRGLFARRKRPMPPQNELQAMFPAGSRVIRNPHGTAPGIDLEAPRDGLPPCRVFVLPGVPAEMIEMWNDSVAEAICGLPGRGRIIRRRRVNCFGAGESQIESMLPDLIRRGRDPTVGINASKATIILRIAAEGDSEAECDATVESTVATIRQCLGTLVFGEEDDELQHVVVRMLRERGQTLAAAEWGTAGLVTDWLGGVEGAGGTFLGGVVATNEAACRKLLGMGNEVAGAAHDAEEYVSAMATACRERFGADFGLSIGPFPSAVVKKWGLAPSRHVQSPQDRCQARCLSPFFHNPAAAAPASEPPPLHFALASAAGVRRLHISSGIHPALVRIYCAKHALNFVRLAML